MTGQVGSLAPEYSVVMDSIKGIKEKIKLHNWAQEIEACKASELTVKEWCHAHNMSMATYYRHLKLVRRAALDGSLHYPVANEASFSGFAEITPQNFSVTTEISGDTLQTASCAVKLNVRGMDIEIFNGADKNTLVALLFAINEI